MDKEARIVGISWNYKENTPLSKAQELFDREDAVLKVTGMDGEPLLIIPLKFLPHYSGGPHDYFILQDPIRAGDVKEWWMPNWVGAIRLRLADGEILWIINDPQAKIKK